MPLNWHAKVASKCEKKKQQQRGSGANMEAISSPRWFWGFCSGPGSDDMGIKCGRREVIGGSRGGGGEEHIKMRKRMKPAPLIRWKSQSW